MMLKKNLKKLCMKKLVKMEINYQVDKDKLFGCYVSLLKDNRMIILDEPTSSLDENNKIKVIALIEELSKNRNIILNYT